MVRKVRFSLWLVLLLTGLMMIITASVQAATPVIEVLHVEGTINPVLADYINRGIEQAEDDRAVACIIEMDTPGGLDTAMRDIITDIVNSQVPVVVYVSPSGGRAASAGVYITMAAHVAAMAPNTAIGAASPVSMSSEGEQEMSETMQNKVMNDAAAYIRSIAEAHGRNMDWAERAVREAVSATEQEALQLNVIDMIAPDLDTLIKQIDGYEVTMLDGRQVTIETADASVKRVDMTGIEQFLYTIADPNIAYILMSIAMMGIMAEVFNPGLIFPGVLGGICLLLAFYSLGMLPVNIAGILLIVLAFGLFIAEVFTSSFGLFTAGGIVSLVFGSLILFKDSAGYAFRVDPAVIATVTIIIAAFFAFVVTYVVKVHRKQATTGKEGLTGKTALVKVTLNPQGMVMYKGERWNAELDEGKARQGEEVLITGIEGLVLKVKKKAPEQEE